MVDLVDLVVDVGDLPQLEGLGELTLKPLFVLCVPTVVKNWYKIILEMSHGRFTDLVVDVGDLPQ